MLESSLIKLVGDEIEGKGNSIAGYQEMIVVCFGKRNRTIKHKYQAIGEKLTI